MTEREEGLHWYYSAHYYACEAPGKDFVKGAGILAALSPCLPWDANVESFRQVIRGEEPNRQSKANRDKAQAIMSGVHPLDVLGGLKVRSFFLNIAYPDWEVGVTIDRHAYSACAGRRLTDTECQQLGPPEYELAQKLYSAVAFQQGILPSQLQAICWLSWRRTHGKGVK
jgi:hypothetical protein